MRFSLKPCWPLFIYFITTWSPMLFGGNSSVQLLDGDKVNLALRRTADKLLRISGDSTSHIAPVEQAGVSTWHIRIEGPVRYDTLPFLLQASLELHGVDMPYDVLIRECTQDILVLGYHQADFIQDTVAPCMGREEPVGCHYIEIRFSSGDSAFDAKSASGIFVFSLLFLIGGGAWWWLRRKKPSTIPSVVGENSQWIPFGQSRLHASGQLVETNGSKQSLTYREAKLLRLFAEHPDQLLQREVILQQVWADEGVQVGRSIDMFVSRLRKKLQPDPTIGIVAVHGVGYRLEVKKL